MAFRLKRMRQRGQSLVEFVIVAPVLLFFCFGLLQYALMFQAKATLDSAVLEAAREGAVNHAELGPMQRALARGLAPLHAHEATETGAVTARARAIRDVQENARIAIVNPTRAQLDDFGQTRYDPEARKTVREIPNELLRYRRTDIGLASGTSIQDANLLKIRVHYCYDMVVPFVNRVVYYAVNGIGALSRDGLSPTEPVDANQDPYGSPVTPDFMCRRKLEDGRMTGRWPIALESEVVVRMQSTYRGAVGQDVDR
ncbi:TadE/TadG family type IV pilus assembly protein [Burkholderia orbicola]|uniref:TadE/TadG family type IV pilus assembly protein n=2 Tax=Burkholderia orbicola TaxID=2978683 RepID=A0ABT8P305_9BURK|nr:TadE/TadG family type IV pilus assembly protein [Burkholderia orbicola]